MNFDDLDITTQRKLSESAKLLSYEANNLKMLAMHQSNSKTRLILGGKRSGKTTWGVVECIWAGLGIHPFNLYPPPPLRIRICGVDFTAGIKGIILPAFYEWLPKYCLPPHGRYWAEDRIFEMPNGTTYEFKSYDQDLEKFEGVGRHLVWMDEEPPKEIYQSNYWRTFFKDEKGIPQNGKLIITCTPLHGMTWLYDELYDNPLAIPPAVEHCHVRIYDNPHLNKEAIDQALKDPALADNLEAAIEGKFISKSGLIYKEFESTPGRHIIKPVAPVPDNWLIVLGIDPHDRNPHGVVFCGLTPENVWVVYDEILEHCILSELVVKIKVKMGKRWPPNLAIIDTSGSSPQSITGRSVKEELTQKYGLYVIDAHKDVLAGRLKVAGLLSPGEKLLPKLYVTENCRQTIREFRHYIWDDWAHITKDKLNPKERPMKKDDHLLDAIRYVVMSNIVYRHPSFTIKPPSTEYGSSVTGYR